MQTSSLKPLHSVWLPSVGLALLLLGASTPRLAAQQSWNFDGQNDTPFSRYQIPASAGYGTPSYSFPTNPASAGNYGYRINQPAIASDPGSYFNVRAGAMWTNGAGTLYGVQDANLGRYSAGADLLAWNPTYVNQVVGIASLVQFTSFTSGSLVVGGWASGAFALAVAEVSGFPIFELWGTSAFGETVLNPTHQYRLVFGSWNAANPDGFGTAFHLLQLFDKGNTNTAWQSAMGVDVNGTTWVHPGYCGIMVANVDAPPPIPPPFGGNVTEGADATFDNYYAYQPVFNLTPATMPAVVCDTYPPPCGSAPQFNPTNLVAIVSQETNLKDQADIHLYLDGVQIPDSSLNIEFGTGDSGSPFYGDGFGVHKFNPLNGSGFPVVFPGATITHLITYNFPPLSLHTNMVTFEDDQNVWHTNSWTWTSAYPYLFTSNSLPLGSLTVPGLATRTTWVPAVPNGTYPGIIKSSAAAQMLLNNTSFSPVNLRSTNTAQTVDWGTTGSEFTGATPFPGLYFTNGAFETMAIQAQTYLQLAAGTNKFHVIADDTFGMYSPGDPSNPGTVLFETPYDTNPNTDFVVVAQAAGLYPVNIYYMNGGGPAACLLQSYDSNNNLQIVGDVANGGMPAYILEPGALQVNITPSGAVTGGAQWQVDGGALHNNGDTVTGLMPGSHTVTYTAATGYITPPSTNVTVVSTQTYIVTGAYLPAGPTLWSTAQIQKTGTSWTQETGAILNTVAKTLTLTQPTANRYYQLRGSVQYQITLVTRSSGNIVLTYQ